MLCGLAAMVKTSILNGLSFDPFSFKQDGLASSKVDIGGSEIADARDIADDYSERRSGRSWLRDRPEDSSSQAGCGSSASGAIVRSCLGSKDVAAHHGCDQSRCLLAIIR